jgi:hypothetical protein
MRAVGRACGLGRTEEGQQLLRETAGTARSERCRALLTATGVCLAFLQGEPQRAVDQATTALKSAGDDSIACVLAHAATAAGLAVTGETTRALEAAGSGWAALERAPVGPLMAFARLALAQAEVLALRFGGRLRDLERRAAELYENHLAAPAWAGDAVMALFRGYAALASGHPRTAIRWLTEAFPGLGDCDPTGMLPVRVSEQAVAKVLVGDVDGARTILTDAERGPHRAFGVVRPQALRAEAWLAAAEGRTAGGGDLALAAAAAAAATGQRAVEAVMLHQALWFGRAVEVRDGLRRLADDLESPLVTACAAHAEARLAGNGGRLDEVSAHFETTGAVLLAAFAAEGAARAHEGNGDKRGAARSRSRASSLAREPTCHPRMAW